MRTRIKKILRLFGTILSAFMIVVVVAYVSRSILLREWNSIPLEGNGTKENPFIIDSYASLELFRDLVNEGEDFSNQYILQTANIDLMNKEWIPIGIYGTNHYFEGIYDGGGHYVENLLIANGASAQEKSGFFGSLSGIVKNFGIESGYIEGNCAGSICCYGDSNCQILNCYNKATVVGQLRAGGIADNLDSGCVIACVNMGMLDAPTTGTVSKNAKMVCAIFPEELPASFSGLNYQISTNELGDVYEMLDQYLRELIRLEIIQRKDVTMWHN